MINLTKGQTINLSKEGGGAGLTKIALGTGWGQKETKRNVTERTGGFLGFGGKTKQVEKTVKSSVDLDASCIMLDSNKKVVDTIWFGQKRSKCSSVIHSGDDMSGGGDPNVPNEIINVDLSKVPANVTTLAFTVNCFSGTNAFAGVPNSFSCLTNLDNNVEIARYNLENEGGSYSAVILSKVYRNNGEWKFKAIGTTASGRTIRDIAPSVQRCI